jgi:acyl carrier protein
MLVFSAALSRHNIVSRPIRPNPPSRRSPAGAGFIFSPKPLNQRLGLRTARSGSGDKPCPGRPVVNIATERDLTDNPQDREQLVNEIIEVVAAEGMIDRSKVTPDATIESLDLKSVDIVMILTALEEKFNVYIPMDGNLQEAKDVKSLINTIADLIIKEREKS